MIMMHCLSAQHTGGGGLLSVPALRGSAAGLGMEMFRV